MANTATLKSMRDRARKRADMGGFFSDSDIDALINEAYCELYDTLVLMFENYFVASPYTLTLSPGTDTYALPTDFYKLISVDMQLGNGTYTSLFPYSETERNSVLSQNANSIPAATVRLRYVPVPTPLVNDSDAINVFSGWDSLIITDAAIAMLDTEESDTTALERRRMRTMKRLEEVAQNRNIGMPAVIQDVYAPRNAFLYDSLRYHMYGNNLQFISMAYLGVP